MKRHIATASFILGVCGTIWGLYLWRSDYVWHVQATHQVAVYEDAQTRRAELIESLAAARIAMRNDELELKTANIKNEIARLEGRRPNDAPAYLSAALEYDKISIDAKELEIAMPVHESVKLDLAMESRTRMEKRIAIGFASLFCIGFGSYFMGKSPPGMQGIAIREAA